MHKNAKIISISSAQDPSSCKTEAKHERDEWKMHTPVQHGCPWNPSEQTIHSSRVGRGRYINKTARRETGASSGLGGYPLNILTTARKPRFWDTRGPWCAGAAAPSVSRRFCSATPRRARPSVLSLNLRPARKPRSSDSKPAAGRENKKKKKSHLHYTAAMRFVIYWVFFQCRRRANFMAGDRLIMADKMTRTPRILQSSQYWERLGIYWIVILSVITYLFL